MRQQIGGNLMRQDILHVGGDLQNVDGEAGNKRNVDGGDLPNV